MQELPLHAVCILLKVCPSGKVCTPAMLKRKINELRRMLREAYKNKKKAHVNSDMNKTNNILSEGLKEISNELKISNLYKDLNLWERIKLLLGFDVHRDVDS